MYQPSMTTERNSLTTDTAGDITSKFPASNSRWLSISVLRPSFESNKLTEKIGYDEAYPATIPSSIEVRVQS